MPDLLASKPVVHGVLLVPRRVAGRQVRSILERRPNAVEHQHVVLFHPLVVIRVSDFQGQHAEVRHVLPVDNGRSTASTARHTSSARISTKSSSRCSPRRKLTTCACGAAQGDWPCSSERATGIEPA